VIIFNHCHHSISNQKKVTQVQETTSYVVIFHDVKSIINKSNRINEFIIKVVLEEKKDQQHQHKAVAEWKEKCRRKDNENE